MRQRAEVHADDRKHARIGSVAEDAAGKLRSGEEFFDEHCLLVRLEKEAYLRLQLVRTTNEVALCDALRGAFVYGLHEKRHDLRGRRQW